MDDVTRVLDIDELRKYRALILKSSLAINLFCFVFVSLGFPPFPYVFLIKLGMRWLAISFWLCGYSSM